MLSRNPLLFAFFSFLIIELDAFTARPISFGHGGVVGTRFTPITHSGTITSLSAKKKRRRRKRQEKNPEEVDAPPPTFQSSPTLEDGLFQQNMGGDLPDFELEEDREVTEKAPPINLASPFDGGVTPNEMIGSSNNFDSERSIEELIADRSLERKFEFDEPVDGGGEEIPDLIAMSRAAQNTGGAPTVSGGVGKKRARQQERIRQATLRAEFDDGKTGNPLENIDFITDDDGKIALNKVLEAGAWLGIALLVLWEIYINSPLFGRSAPMVPVVY